MNQPGSYGSDASGNSFGGGPLEGRERGGRRKKLAGYLKAANELRQSYQQSYSASRNVEQEGDNLGIPGAFPDVSVTRHGDEELILFPSYCKRHVKEQPKPARVDSDMSTDSNTPTDAEYWKREWEKFEDDKAIVDVDVRGWVYSPHKGPITRKNRLLIGLARQLSGIPAPKAASNSSRSRDNSPDPISLRGRHEAHQAQRDQERISREADEILKKGEGEAALAAQGRFSEQPARYDSDDDSIYGDRGRESGNHSPRASPGDAPGPGHLPKRASWNQPSEMSPEELATANSHLMARLMPFMTNPLVSTPITVFFYDEERSQSKTVMTNDSGHFNIRAALDFAPTHVRVLASENLSATEEVKITEPKGVSLISDVDDTVKHSSIGSGAREIFRNAFIRDLADLTIDGVKEWYNTMYDMGVGIHYVSNSPWQLFPVLVSFFQTAGLPPGSYHLKQYSGMLQGIFEPVAERKKGTLERILRDFPERRFLLIGDSGEADLEVYTDVAVANPGRVIGIFIRDVTSPVDHGFFDSAMGALSGDRRAGNRVQSRGRSGDSYKPSFSQNSDSPEKRPPLPTRIVTEAKPQTSTGPAMGNLIDFDDEPEEMKIHEPHKTILPRSMSDLEQLDVDRQRAVAQDKPKSKTPPARPVKPLSLRSNTGDSITPKTSSLPAAGRGSAPPPPPPRASRPRSTNDESRTTHPLSQTQNTSEITNRPRDPNQSYISQARDKVSSAYNALPSASAYLSGDSPSQRPLPPPRRGVTATAASYLPSTNRLSWHNNNSSSLNIARSTHSLDSSDDEISPDTPPVNKKLDLWRRRWRRAQEILGAQGVELRSWRKGEDVCIDAIKLVEKNMRELGVEGYGTKGSGDKGKTGEGGGEVKVKDLKR
jgi:phosphatidate phosphatase APP1